MGVLRKPAVCGGEAWEKTSVLENSMWESLFEGILQYCCLWEARTFVCEPLML